MLYKIKNFICVSEDIQDAARHIESLVSVEPDSEASVLTRLQKTMAPMPLSCCMAVCTYAIFNHFYEQDAHQEDCFLDAFHNLHMNKLRHQSHFYEAQQKKALEQAKINQRRFMSHSFFDLSKALQEEEAIEADITRLEQDVADSAQNALSHYLFPADVVAHLEQQKLLPRSQAERIKSDMLQCPIEWMKKLLPSLLQLSTLAYNQEEAEPSYKAVIEDILNVFNINFSLQTTTLQDLQQALLGKHLEKHMEKPPESPSYTLA